MPHSLFFIIWALVLFVFLARPLYQIIQNRATKAAMARFAKQLQQNSALSEEVAATLYKPVACTSLESGLLNRNLLSLLSKLPLQAGDFLIHSRHWLSEDNCLLLTTVDYRRPDDNGLRPYPRGLYPTTRITYNLNFLVKLDTLKNQVVVFSDSYSTLVNKNLRADFAFTMFKLLQL